MKLIYCPHCEDVRKLNTTLTTCNCGRSYGQYLPDDLNAAIGGDAIPLGFANPTLVKALRTRPEKGLGSHFEAFVIPKCCPTIHTMRNNDACATN